MNAAASARLLVPLCLAACLFGCGGAAAEHPASSAAPSPSPDPPQVEYLSSASTAAGFYDIVLHGDGTGNLVYYDYGTMQCVYLSSQPNSDHRDESDTSFLPTVVGGAWALADSRHLYVLKDTCPFANDEALKAGYLMRMEHSGQGRQTVPLPSDTRLFGGCAILGEDKMLTTLCQVKEETSEEWYMAEVDFDTGTIRRRLDFEGASAVQLTGACARGPILILREPEKERRLCLYDVEQDALEPIPFDIEDETWCLDDTSGTIYCLEGSKICRYDVASGQRQSTGRSLPAGDWTEAAVNEFVDGYLSVTLSGPGEEDYDRIALCLATGEVFRPGMEDEGKPVTVAAVTPEGYLVKLGGIPVKYQDYTPDGVPFENEAFLSHYAMMDKADYWNDRPNWREFTNLAYEDYSLL